MELLAVVLVLVSALMHSFRDLFTKKSEDKQAFVWWYELAAVVIYSPLFAYILLTSGFPSQAAILISLIASLVHFAYWIFLSKSLQHGDLSHVYPIMRSSPGPVLILSIIFIQENVTLLGALGILLVMAGIYIINMRKLTLSEILAPIRSITGEKATQYALAVLLAVSIYSIIDKFAVSSVVNPLVYIYLINFFALALFTPYIASTTSVAILKNEWKTNKKTIILNGFIVIFSYALILIAFTMENAGYVVGLRQLSVIFAVIWGGHLLNEKNNRIRLLASVITFIGAFLIAIA